MSRGGSQTREQLLSWWSSLTSIKQKQVLGVDSIFFNFLKIPGPVYIFQNLCPEEFVSHYRKRAVHWHVLSLMGSSIWPRTNPWVDVGITVTCPPSEHCQGVVSITPVHSSLCIDTTEVTWVSCLHPWCPSVLGWTQGMKWESQAQKSCFYISPSSKPLGLWPTLTPQVLLKTKKS